jgi:hypothetical protein
MDQTINYQKFANNYNKFANSPRPCRPLRSGTKQGLLGCFASRIKNSITLFVKYQIA